jgi:hypothetical protein
VTNSIEKMSKTYKNLNIEINDHTTYNRFMLLIEDMYHGQVVEETMNTHKDQIKQELMTTFMQEQFLD